MSVGAVPRKQVELSALPAEATKARRIFILADGKRTLDQIYQLCKLDEDEGTALVNILVDEGCISLEGDVAPAREVEVVPSGEGVPVADVVEKLTAELANHIGPIAPILVKRAALPENEISKEHLGKVITSLAEEIEAEEDRQTFLTKMEASLL